MKLDLYHGSERIIKQPEYGKGNRRNDYGMAFYTTQDVDLAMEWAVEKDRSGYANHYKLDTNGLKILNLSDEQYSILNWITILINNRLFEVHTDFGNEALAYLNEQFLLDYSSYDVIIGHRADDSYFTFAQDFLNNEISLGTLQKAMKLGVLGEQIAIKSKKAIDSLEFVESIEASSDIWYPGKERRDTMARQSYRELRKASWKKGEIYIMNIIDQEIKSDDVRLRPELII